MFYQKPMFLGLTSGQQDPPAQVDQFRKKTKWGPRKTYRCCRASSKYYRADIEDGIGVFYFSLSKTGVLGLLISSWGPNTVFPNIVSLGTLHVALDAPLQP